MPQSSVPSVAGNLGGSSALEAFNKGVEAYLKNSGGNNEKE
ncbi:hypothetical protein [Candidatus Pantoea bituminis]|nr:hypothetical protein [Pantoea bituminis]